MEGCKKGGMQEQKATGKEGYTGNRLKKPRTQKMTILI